MDGTWEMITASTALSSLPTSLVTELVSEYQGIAQNFLEHRWLPSELSGGRFSEIVYTILDGQAKGTYPLRSTKPANFVNACRALEGNSHVPRSFQILIPRLLPGLYEIRNNRSVGHVGGDVDPNHMDAIAVLSICNWIMGELVRVFHGLTIVEAQGLVDALAETRTPAVWSDGSVKRVLQPTLKLPDQVLLLIATSLPSVRFVDLLSWTEAPDKQYFVKILRRLHKGRLIEFEENSGVVRILPPGTRYVQELVLRNNLSNVL
jgi:hypothetical protein